MMFAPCFRLLSQSSLETSLTLFSTSLDANLRHWQPLVEPPRRFTQSRLTNTFHFLHSQFVLRFRNTNGTLLSLFDNLSLTPAGFCE